MYALTQMRHRDIKMFIGSMQNLLKAVNLPDMAEALGTSLETLKDFKESDRVKGGSSVLEKFIENPEIYYIYYSDVSFVPILVSSPLELMSRNNNLIEEKEASFDKSKNYKADIGTFKNNAKALLKSKVSISQLNLLGTRRYCHSFRF